MCKIVLLLASCLTSIAAFPEQQRIAGGTVATLAQHPYTAVVLYAQNTVNFRQTCGGAIINNRSVLSALSCWVGSDNYPNTYRVRVGSVNATAAGVLHNVALMISHPHYNAWNQDNNIGIIRVATIITLGASVRPIPIAGSNYHLADYQMVWAIGWGRTTANSINSEQLRRVEVMTVNQGRCEDIYGVGFVTANMLCAGWQASPGRGSCLGDTGSPLVHNNVAVGVTSFAIGCGDINYPAIYSRVSRFTPWIQSNA